MSALLAKRSLYLIQPILIATILAIGLNLPSRGLEVPFGFGGDAMHHLLVTQAIIESGWWWHIPRLSAPFELPMVAFPAGGTTDYLIIKIISCLVPDKQPGIVLNLFWLFSFILTGTSAMWSLRRLGRSHVIAFTIGTLYAFLPHAFYRNLGHLMLVFYLVPIIAAFAISIMQGTFANFRKWDKAIFYLACVAVGFNYVYTAFFSCFVLMIAGFLGLLTKDGRKFALAVTATIIIVVSVILNLQPTLCAWQSNPGTKEILQAKSPMEAEIYGLKLRHLLIPVQNHPIPLWNKFEQLNVTASFPLETENTMAKLGTTAALGFLVLLIISLLGFIRNLSPNTCLYQLQPAASLNLAVFLLATIGGLGAIFNLLVSPDIRAYNRSAVFIAFFAFYAIGVLLSRIEVTTYKKLWQRGTFILFLITLIPFGIMDQTAPWLFQKNSPFAPNPEYFDVKALVTKMEQILPNQAMVYQLPYVSYPHTPVVNQMQSQQHIAAYVVSRYLRWSYPALTAEAANWNRHLNENAPADLAEKLKLAGFKGIWVDRFGYADNGNQIIQALQTVAISSSLSSPSGRYVFIHLAN